MKDFIYILEKYKGLKSRYTCPQCGRRNEFTRYIHRETGEYLSDNVGICNRVNKCNYHYTPKDFFQDNKKPFPVSLHLEKRNEETLNRPLDYLPFELMERSVRQHKRCNLYLYLVKLFKEDVARKLCEEYLIGSDKRGNTVIWQYDISFKVREAQVFVYDPVRGKRSQKIHPFYLGKRILNKEDPNLEHCFHGEHLLAMDENKNKKVGIVESAKTAAIASVYYPNRVWLATAGATGCKWTQRSVCKVLKGKEVKLFPDLGKYDSWKDKGQTMAAIAGCKKVDITDVLEKIATNEEKKDGLDIADYLTEIPDSTGLALSKYNYPIFWDFIK